MRARFLFVNPCRLNRLFSASSRFFIHMMILFPRENN